MSANKFSVESKLFTACGLSVLFACAGGKLLAVDVPSDWVDPDTGHRIVRLSQEGGTESLYFHQNGYTPDGQKMVLLTPEGVATVDLKTRKIDLVVPGVARTTNSVAGVVVGRKTPTVYYSRWDGSNNVAYATDLNTHVTREIGALPSKGRGGSLGTVNADETWLAGSCLEGQPANLEGVFRDSQRSKGEWMEERVQLHLPMHLFTMNIKTGEIHTFNRSTDWLNHVQASPTDPDLLMFCHEGPWHWVDRIWTIRPSGGEAQLVQPRTMEMEIAGHEFFGADGKTIWYDLQTPRGEDFWLGGYEIATGRRTWYHLERNQWSVHYNVSRDGSLFAGDGGDGGMVAHAPDGKWIYLFRPELEKSREKAPVPDKAGLIQAGVFHAERLVNMKHHDYKLEPNVNFTPDGKWIVFRSNMFGPAHVFAVEVARDEK
jgi:oligogalacturonide lyase